jgi:capsular polysaccharide transport system permease protein
MKIPKPLSDLIPGIKLSIETAMLFCQSQMHAGRLLMLVVYMPTSAIALYFFIFASDMYISESSFAVISGDSSYMPNQLGLLAQISGGGTVMDAFLVQEHITSLDMVERIEQRLDIRQHYADASRDVFSRLRRSPTREQILDYWRWMVSAAFDLDRGIIFVEVKAYTPEMARAVNGAILQCSEELVNEMNSRAHQDAIRLSKAEVSLAEKRLEQAQLALQQFRDDKSVVDPKLTVENLEGVIARLEGEAALTEAELGAALSLMREDSLRVLNIKTRLQALHEQLRTERARLSGLARDGTISALLGSYAQLTTEEEFARQQLLTAMTSLEQARIRAFTQTRYIVPLQPPTQPEESLYPRPVLYTVVAFLGLLVLLGMCSLLIAAVKDHMGV